MANDSKEEAFIQAVKAVVERLADGGLPMKQRQYPPVLTEADLLNTGERGAMINAVNAVIELGHPATASLFMAMVTERDDLVVKDRMTIIGPDFQELSPGRHSFALIMLARSREASESDRRALLGLVTRCELPVGCMIRASSGKIWVRFSRDALDKQVTSETLGRCLLAESHKHGDVLRKVEIILIVAGDDEIEMLQTIADGLATERNVRYRAALAEKMECATGLDCDDCPETETCSVLKDAVAVRRRKRNVQ